MMSRSHGEYAFTLIDLVDRCVWFARDYFGRRSLCWNVSRSIPEIVENLVWKVGHRSECFDKCGWISMGIMQEFQLCSVVAVDGAKTATWSEVPAYGLFRLSFHDPKELSLDFIPWRKHSSSKTSHDDAVMLYKPFPIEFHLKNFDLKDQMLYSCKEDVRCELYRQLAKAIDRRVHNEESIGILYSGGLDSTVLAFLADECLPQSASIYLLNVSFEAASPDRLNAIESLRDLQRVRPQRDWRFVPVDCDRDQLSRTRVERIGPLIAPKNTVLDDSIGCALWFAASGVRCRPDFEPQPFRVLLVGSGADEQLGGYSRHWAAFGRGGLKMLTDEIERDVGRISDRNLGRDDRVLADHAIEARFPYLDESVVAFLNSVPLPLKCDLTQERGKGDKQVLRELAADLGLKYCSELPKRAIQFGSRIARLEQRKERAIDVCNRLV